MSQVKDVLRQTRRLDDASDLNGTFILDEFPDGEKEIRGELSRSANVNYTNVMMIGWLLTSEYHRNCHATSLIKAPTALLPSP